MKTDTGSRARQNVAIRAYREKRDAWIAACDKADAAFARYWHKLTNGIPTNAAQATRLDHLANYASADMFAAQGRLFLLGVDPWEIDREDGVEETPLPYNNT